MPGNVLIGTASWTDPTLIKCKCFYPDDVKTPEERLRFYASRFPVVEVAAASTPCRRSTTQCSGPSERLRISSST